MRKTLIATAVAAAAVVTPASAIGISMNYVTMPGVTLQDCMGRSQMALQNSGVRMLPPTTEAQWAENADGTQIFTVYCLFRNGLAVVIGAGPSSRDVDPVVSTIVNGLTGRGGPAAVPPRNPLTGGGGGTIK